MARRGRTSPDSHGPGPRSPAPLADPAGAGDREALPPKPTCLGQVSLITTIATGGVAVGCDGADRGARGDERPAR